MSKKAAIAWKKMQESSYVRDDVNSQNCGRGIPRQELKKGSSGVIVWSMSSQMIISGSVRSSELLVLIVTNSNQ